MTSSPSEPTGLRERKKAKTRAAIQRHALRLFREQGYGATTVDQIAAAAEISPSTFFRYFATKEAAVLYDPVDPVFIATAIAQPAELGLIPAMRATVADVLARFSEDEMEDIRQRQLMVFREPELRAATMDQFAEGIELIADVAARRTGRAPDDFAVRNWAGAVVGVLLAAFIKAAGDPGSDYLVLLDEALVHLESGLPL